MLRERGVPYVVAKTWTTDGLYRETPDRIRRRRAEGCLTVGEERDLFDFVLVATLENGRLVAQSIDVPAEQPA